MVDLHDSQSRRQSGPPDPLGASSFTPSEDREIATLKQDWERRKHIVSLPGTFPPPNETGINNSRLSNIVGDGTVTSLQPDGANHPTRANVNESNTVSETMPRGSEAGMKRNLDLVEGPIEDSKSAGERRAGVASGLIRKPSPLPARRMSSPRPVTTQIHRSIGRAHPPVITSQGEASSPLPLPSSQKPTRKEDEENSDMEQDGHPSVQPKSRRLSGQYLFELNDDEDGLYDFEVEAPAAKAL